MINQIEKDLHIDCEALDIECLNQANLAWKYINLAHQARKKARQAEEYLKTIRSELIAKVNKDSEGCVNKAKPNVHDIEAYYRTHKQYKAAKTEMIDAQLEADLVQQGKDLFVFQRKASLENLINLHGQQYFAGPKVPRNLEQEVKRQREQADVKVKEAMRRRKK